MVECFILPGINTVFEGIWNQALGAWRNNRWYEHGIVMRWSLYKSDITRLLLVNHYLQCTKVKCMARAIWCTGGEVAIKEKRGGKYKATMISTGWSILRHLIPSLVVYSTSMLSVHFFEFGRMQHIVLWLMRIVWLQNIVRTEWFLDWANYW